MSGHPTQTEELLAHGRWLRSLARSLVRDAPTADDLVQDTYLAALRHPPKRALRPWLARVLKNLALQRRRADCRRERREEIGAHSESLPSSAELSERLEVQHRIVEAVLALEEPYRSAIVLRFYEGLSAAEIARRQGVTGSTVCTQVARGLEQLRRTLDEEVPGGRRVWVSSLTPWVFEPRSVAPAGPGGQAETGGAGLLRGALTMSMGWKLGVATVIVAAVTVGVRLGNRDRDARPAFVGVSAGEPRSAGSESAPPAPPNASVPREAVIGDVDESASDAVVAVAEEAVVPDWVVEARIVDEGGEPIVGAKLGISLPQFDYSSFATSDESGRVRFVLAEHWYDGGFIPLGVSADGYAPRRIMENVERGVPRDLGEIVLFDGASISGRIVGPDDLPVAAARVELGAAATQFPINARRHTGPDPNGVLHRSESDADGAFEMIDVSLGVHQVFARTRDTLWTLSSPLRVESGVVIDDLVLRLEPIPPGEQVTGVVLDPDGSPIPSAFVVCDVTGFGGSHVSRHERTDADGRFAVLAQATHDYRAVDSKGAWPDAVAREVAPGADLVLRFRVSRMLTVRAIAASGGAPGEPIPGLQLEVYDDQSGVVFEGRGGADFLEPDVPYSIRIHAAGFALSELGPFAPNEAPNPIECTLDRLTALRGRVVGGAFGEQPIQGARVELFSVAAVTDAYSELIYDRGFRSSVVPFVLQTTRTDAAGRFVFHPSPGLDYVIRAEPPEDPSASSAVAPAELRVAFDSGAEEVTLFLSTGGAIEGRVIAVADEDVAGTRVVASRGDSRFVEVRVGSDGRFRFEGLIPGPWNVEIADAQIEGLGVTHRVSGELPEIPSVCEVVGGSTRVYDLDLSTLSRCRLQGRMLADGAPISSWTARLRPGRETGYYGRPSLSPRTVVDANGAFQLAVPRAGDYELAFEDPDSDLVIRFTVGFDEGDSSWERAIELGRVELDGIPRTAAALHIAWDGPDGELATSHFAGDASGRATIPRFPAGEVRVFRWGAVGAPPVTLATAQVRAGETTRITLP